MWILHQALVLLSVVSFLEAQNPTELSECESMNADAGKLQNIIKFLVQTDVRCSSNQHCTGLTCSWSGGGFLEVDLHHCQHPIYYHVLLKYPARKIHSSLNVTKGEEKTLLQQKSITGKIKVKELNRSENIVTTTVVLEGCFSRVLCKTTTIMDNQKFCVKMQNCPGYNESAHQYVPCEDKPVSTGPGKAQISPRHSSPGHPSDGKGGDADNKKGRPSGGKGGDADNKKNLSTAAIIGICAAAAFAILVVVGVVVYWKKYHHRSQLRAAYYNDISMHDPLYEDFGPEVA